MARGHAGLIGGRAGPHGPGPAPPGRVHGGARTRKAVTEEGRRDRRIDMAHPDGAGCADARHRLRRSATRAGRRDRSGWLRARPPGAATPGRRRLAAKRLALLPAFTSDLHQARDGPVGARSTGAFRSRLHPCPMPWFVRLVLGSGSRVVRRVVRRVPEIAQEAFDRRDPECHDRCQVQQGKEVIQCLTQWWRVRPGRRAGPWSRPPRPADAAGQQSTKPA